MKQVLVTDERGKNWVVYKGDSAWSQCQSLSKMGAAEVVLPRETLLRGNLPAPDSIAIPEIPLEALRMSTDVQAIVRRQIRLKDCVKWLTMNGFGEVAGP